jgi:hypothetical protein
MPPRYQDRSETRSSASNCCRISCVQWKRSLKSGTSDQCVCNNMSQVAERVGTELEIPVLTYGATHPSGRALAALRKQTTFFKKGPGGAQTPSSSGTCSKPHCAQRSFHHKDERSHTRCATCSVVLPDFGPATARPESGITVCGATPYVLNFNIALATTDLSVGKKLAKAIRAATPGYRTMRVVGPSRALCHVSAS